MYEPLLTDNRAMIEILPSGNEVRIVENWDAQNAPTSIHVFSSMKQVELVVNGKSLGTKMVPHYGYALFNNVQYAPGTIVAYGVDESGKRVSNHTLKSAKAAHAITLIIDAPSPSTGTVI